MKKLFALLLAALMVFTVSAALAEEEKVLNLYASTPEPYLTQMIEGYEELTGIKVELVSAGTSELYKMVQTEIENGDVVCDVLRGGMMWGSYVPIKDCLMEYVSPLNDQLPEDCQVIFDRIYGFSYVPSVMMVNTEKLAELGVEVHGYEDLLQPELYGQVTIPDPVQTSSGWEQVVNMLWAMGGGDTEEGWAYFDKLMANGLVINASSGATHKSVAAGEYAIGLVAEGMATTYIAEGLPIELVWPVEGVVMNSDGIAAVKDCPHPENAKKFIDYLISETYQNIMLNNDVQLRPVLDNLETEMTLTPVSEMNKISVDYEYLAANKPQMLDHAKDIMTNYM